MTSINCINVDAYWSDSYSIILRLQSRDIVNDNVTGYNYSRNTFVEGPRNEAG